MVLGAVLGVTQVYVGLLVSWYAETAAGATITLLGGLTFLVVLAVREVVCRVHFANAHDNHFH
jgi:zinc/manganese transport system permease protein